MMLYRKILVFTLACLVTACSGGEPKPSTPLETLQAYEKAVRQKDTTTMKLLLSEATIKIHQEAAKEQGVTLDEIVQREALFAPGQKRRDYRNETIEGDRASIEIKNPYGIWDKVDFVKEDGTWKIDKQAFVNPILQQNEMDNQRLDEIINQGKQP
jgi:Domain of unknown function (DUF4878)